MVDPDAAEQARTDMTEVLRALRAADRYFGAQDKADAIRAGTIDPDAEAPNSALRTRIQLGLSAAQRTDDTLRAAGNSR